MFTGVESSALIETKDAGVCGYGTISLYEMSHPLLASCGCRYREWRRQWLAQVLIRRAYFYNRGRKQFEVISMRLCL